MKRLFILLLMVPFCSVLWGQRRSGDFQRVQLGLVFSPDYSYRTLTGSDEHGFLSMRNDYDIPKFGFSAGLGVCFNVNSLIGIESGLQYTNRGYRTKKTHLEVNDPVLNSQWIRSVYGYHYIDVPLKARLTVGQKKVRFSASAGVTTGFLVGSTSTIQYEGGSDRASHPTDGYNHVNLFPTVSAGLEYKITPKSSLRIEPTFRYGLLKTFAGKGAISEYLWNVGLNISYFIGIK